MALRALALSLVHGLTASETRVLFRPQQGMPIAEVAQSTGRADSTTRLRVERILKKTATHRQSELVLRWVMPMLVSLQGAPERAADA